MQDTAKDEDESVTIIDLLRTPNLRYRTLNFYYNWFVNSFVYYGLSLNSGNLGGDLYINIFIGGAVEIPAYTLSIFALLKTGRRMPLCISMVVGGVACLCTMIFEKGEMTMGRYRKDLMSLKILYLIRLLVTRRLYVVSHCALQCFQWVTC